MKKLQREEEKKRRREDKKTRKQVRCARLDDSSNWMLHLLLKDWEGVVERCVALEERISLTKILFHCRHGPWYWSTYSSCQLTQIVSPESPTLLYFLFCHRGSNHQLGQSELTQPLWSTLTQVARFYNLHYSKSLAPSALPQDSSKDQQWCWESQVLVLAFICVSTFLSCKDIISFDNHLGGRM
jgi:hypothetical protein